MRTLCAHVCVIRFTSDSFEAVTEINLSARTFLDVLHLFWHHYQPRHLINDKHAGGGQKQPQRADPNTRTRTYVGRVLLLVEYIR